MTRYMQKMDTGEVFVYQAHIARKQGWKEVDGKEAERVIRESQKNAAPIIPPEGRSPDDERTKAAEQDNQPTRRREEEAEQQEPASHEAPFGYKKDGTPRKRPAPAHLKKKTG